MPNNDLRPQIERVRKIKGAATCRKAFRDVLKIYLLAKFASPLTSCAPHDLCFRAAYRKWSPDSCHTVIDTERCVERSLGKGALALFLERFARDDEPRFDPPAYFDADERKRWTEFQRNIGASFLHAGLFPLTKWFGLPDRTETA